MIRWKTSTQCNVAAENPAMLSKGGDEGYNTEYLGIELNRPPIKNQTPPPDAYLDRNETDALPCSQNHFERKAVSVACLSLRNSAVDREDDQQMFCR
jgi:hypothetical protein